MCYLVSRLFINFAIMEWSCCRGVQRPIQIRPPSCFTPRWRPLAGIAPGSPLHCLPVLNRKSLREKTCGPGGDPPWKREEPGIMRHQHTISYGRFPFRGNPLNGKPIGPPWPVELHLFFYVAGPEHIVDVARDYPVHYVFVKPACINCQVEWRQVILKAESIKIEVYPL